jgi:DNA-directed RNA polymerase III subunit RPC11
MWFCPCDGTLLQIRTSSGSGGGGGSAPSTGGSLGHAGEPQCWYCPTCPYSCTLDRPHASAASANLARHGSNKRKGRRDANGDDNHDVLGGASAWENVDRTTAPCPSCGHSQAYFVQIQIRSADEPMSVFYKCCRCSHQWNDR